jgi:hypothetical protein
MNSEMSAARRFRASDHPATITASAIISATMATNNAAPEIPQGAHASAWRSLSVPA